MVRIMYIFLKQRNMENIMSFSVSRKCNFICNWPYPIKHFKWPTISWCQLGTTSKLQGTLPWPHLEVNMIPNLKFSYELYFYLHNFFPVLGCLQILPNFSNFLLHFLKHFSPSTILFTRLSQLTGVLHLLPYKASNGLIFNDA
jgi:hypothetical protein